MSERLTSNTKESTDFRATMRKFPATVTVVTGHKDGADHGMTVTAVIPVSMDPPSIAVCLNQQTFLHEILISSAEFVVNVLSHQQQHLSDAFSGQIEPRERFRLATWNRDETGVLKLVDAHANIVCQRVAAVPYGTHTLFIGRVLSSSLGQSTDALLYKNATYCRSKPAS